MDHVDRKVVSVAEFDRQLRKAVEAASGCEWIQGEVSALRRVASGHTYFALKDEREDAIIDCVMYRFQAQRARRFLENGSVLQLLGKATVWAPRGKLQLVCEAVRPAGRGALLAALERLKAQLAAEGLFERARKRKLPTHPRCVGVVTSGHGAAFNDIVTVALRRSRIRVILSPALVQGESAPASLIRALELLERVEQVDAIIIGRGGGSAEDLMAFNDERLVRRIAACTIPTVSAVGHEIDTSLCDLVADARAATPSEAAELVVPDLAAELRKFDAARERLVAAVRARLDEDRLTLSALRAKVTDPRFVIAEKQQLLDELGLRMEREVSRRLRRANRTVSDERQRLSLMHPTAVLSRARNRLEPMTSKLRHGMLIRLSQEDARIDTLSARLSAMSPLSVLRRGYAIVQSEQGEALRTTKTLIPGQRLYIRLSSGRVVAEALTIEHGRSDASAAGLEHNR